GEGKPASACRGRRVHGGQGWGLWGAGVQGGVVQEATFFDAAWRGRGVGVPRPAVGIRYPLTLLSGVIQIQHGGDRVDTQAVSMVDVEPEQRTAEQEALHLLPPIVEHEGVPIRMDALARVSVLVEVRAVEEAQPMRVIREV